MDKDIAIEAVNLTKAFIINTGLFPWKNGVEKTVLKSINIKIKKGELFGIIGRNGSGKTTFLKILSTLIPPTEGTAYINGFSIINEPKKVRMNIGYADGQERSFYWRLTGRQNLEFFATLKGMKFREIKRQIEQISEFFELNNYIDIEYYKYSTGMRNRLAIARAMLGFPLVLFFDEPTRSLDLEMTEKLWKFIKNEFIKKWGSTVIFATNNVDEAIRHSNRRAFFNDGKLKLFNSSNELNEQ